MEKGEDWSCVRHINLLNPFFSFIDGGYGGAYKGEKLYFVALLDGKTEIFFAQNSKLYD